MFPGFSSSYPSSRINCTVKHGHSECIVTFPPGPYDASVLCSSYCQRLHRVWRPETQLQRFGLCLLRPGIWRTGRDITSSLSSPPGKHHLHQI
ncbi:unnamed protein product [Somion occarium]|uniref:Uncharacterized protein n=1 Tax=Somion occarium TaxID=3059160 RepID=A0ABP1D6B7_9APHY